MATTHHDVEPRLLNDRQAAARLGIGRTKLRELLSTGQLRSVRIGRRVLVPVGEVEAYVQRLLEGAR